MNAKLQILMINALNAMLRIIVWKNLIKTIMENAYAKKAIMMMAKIIYASNVIIVGKKNYNYHKIFFLN